MSVIEAARPGIHVEPLCRALTLPRGAYYRLRAGLQRPPRQRVSPRAFSAAERQAVLDVLHSARFVDKAPPEIYATLLDEDRYIGSVRTMYRLLAEAQEVRERRNQARHPKHKKPELVATAPNQVWSWDITRLRTYTKWSYFYLYVILDIFSRFVVGWMLADRENARLAKRLIAETVLKEGIDENQLTLHSDRGSPMVALTTQQLLARLQVTPSYNRPRVSNDNPYSESQFKTVKYHPSFPERFADYNETLGFCRSFFPWYNNEHRHSGIGYLTPAMVHYGISDQVLAARTATLKQAFARHPERFVRGEPRPPALRNQVWINQPRRESADHVH